MITRWAGDSKMRARFGSVLGKTATATEMREALKGDKFKTLKKTLTQDYLGALKEKLTPWMIQRALDVGGGSNKSWQQLFNTMNGAFAEIGLSIHKAIPNPHQQREFCGVMNEAFKGLGAFKVEEGEATVEGADNIMQNVQMDVNKVLQTLVHLYDLRAEEVNGKLKVCLKLDETIWAGDRKMERLTVTVMNRALGGKDSCEPDQWFSVQSEREIWPICMFEVEKESHKTLKQYLEPSQLNEVIKAHNRGETLSVEMDDGEVNTFTVEWHAAGDLKTLKCCNGCATGSMAENTCLYCMHSRGAVVVHAGKEKGKGKATGTKQRRIWSGGIMSCRAKGHFGVAPTRDAQAADGTYTNDPEWDPVLDIPLERTHICTMHCENRMVEKLAHLHICKIWNMPDTAERADRLAAVEEFLGGELGMRLRGAPFKIEKCDKLSGKYGSTPMKPSFNDVRARRFTAHASRRVSKKNEVSLSEIYNLWC